jgi:hypothetical protein
LQPSLLAPPHMLEITPEFSCPFILHSHLEAISPTLGFT